MWKWGKTSLEIRAELHPKLQTLVDMMLANSSFDMSIICGYRGKGAQEKAYADGTSKAKFGQSAHNYRPSYAVDIIPCCPIDWNVKNPRWKYMVENAKMCAAAMGIEITCGYDYKTFKDCPHIELKDWRSHV